MGERVYAWTGGLCAGAALVMVLDGKEPFLTLAIAVVFTARALGDRRIMEDRRGPD